MNNNLTSVKGFEYMMKLDQIFSNFNLFQKDQLKQDLSRKSYQTKIQTTIAICSAAAVGDINEIFRLFNQNSDMNQGDYDARTPLHLASANGHFHIVKFLVEIGVNVNPVDRWGATPLNDAKD